MVKKFLAAFFITAMVLSAACGKETEDDPNTPAATPTEAVEPTTEPVEPEATPTEAAKPTVEPAEPTTVPVTEPTRKPEPTPAVTEKPEATKAPEPTTAPEPTKKPENGGDTTGPVVTLGTYKGLRLSSVSQAELDAELQKILESYMEEKTVSRAAKEGDIVNINYVGKKDGVAFDGGTDDSAEGTNLTLGSGKFIPGFEEGLVGAKAGETLDLNLTFPDPYLSSPDLSGAAVVFTVTVNEVKEVVLPELTDAFVKEISDSRTVKEYKQALKETLTRDSYYEQITTLLMENCTVEKYPMEKIEAEKEAFVSTYTSYADFYGSYYGLDTETALQMFFGIASLEALDQLGEEYAYNVVKSQLILEKIAETEGITVSDKLFKEKLPEYAELYGYETTEEFLTDYSEEDVKNVILIDEVMEFCIDHAVIS